MPARTDQVASILVRDILSLQAESSWEPCLLCSHHISFVSDPFPFISVSFSPPPMPLRRWSHRPPQKSSQVSLEVLFLRCQSRVTGTPDWAISFPTLRVQKCSASTNPLLSVSCTRIAGTQRITGCHVQYIRLELPSLRWQVESPV